MGRVGPGEEDVGAQAGGACCARGEYAVGPVACRLGGDARRRGHQTGQRTGSRGQPGTARRRGKPGLGSHHRSSRNPPPGAACRPAAGNPAAGLLAVVPLAWVRLAWVRLAGDPLAGSHRGGCHGDGRPRARPRAGSRDGSRRGGGHLDRCRSRQDPGTQLPRPGPADPGWVRCLDVSPGTSWTLRYTPCMGTCTFPP